MCVWAVLNCSVMFTFCNTMNYSRFLLSMGFSRQEYWSGLSCSPPGDLPDPGIEPTSLALVVDSSPLSHQGSPKAIILQFLKKT